MRHWRKALIVIAVVCFGVALSYPIRYRLELQSTTTEMQDLSQLRVSRLSQTQTPEQTDHPPTQPLGDSQMEPPADATQNPGGATAGPVRDDEPRPGAAEPAQTEEPIPGAAEPARAEEPLPDDEAQEDGLPAMPHRTTPAPGPTDASAPEVDGPKATMPAGPWARPTDLQPTALPEGAPSPAPTQEPTPSPTPSLQDLMLDFSPKNTMPPPEKTPTPEPTVTAVPTPTPDRHIRSGALPYTEKEKVELDEEKILPELQEIYALNHDLVGWIMIPDTVIDYPVVQCQDSDYYLKHDFYGQDNNNGQIILDTTCDAWTPSYNLIISGHHMNSGAMFGNLPLYNQKSYWEKHKLVYFDTLMARGTYVVIAAFYSADYDEDEEGFRYNADIKYRLEVEQWLKEIRENQIYDTELDAEFGDEFITLTTCYRHRRQDGRFVVIGRKLREGEVIE